MRWEGQMEMLMPSGRWMTITVCSWDKMTDCLKGFTMWRDGFAFEVGAVEPGCSPTERYVYEGAES